MHERMGQLGMIPHYGEAFGMSIAESLCHVLWYNYTQGSMQCRFTKIKTVNLEKHMKIWAKI